MTYVCLLISRESTVSTSRWCPFFFVNCFDFFKLQFNLHDVVKKASSLDHRRLCSVITAPTDHTTDRYGPPPLTVSGDFSHTVLSVGTVKQTFTKMLSEKCQTAYTNICLTSSFILFL